MEDKSMLEALPIEIVANHVVATAAASSSDDLFNIKHSCKILREVCEDPCVLKRVSLDKFNPVPWKQEEIAFCGRCTHAGNPEALYRTGMMQCFAKEEREYGMQNMGAAMNSGHLGAKYAMGIVLLLLGGVNKLNGKSIILSMKKSTRSTSTSTTMTTTFKEIRKNFLEIIKDMWIRSTLIVGQAKPRCCTKHTITNSAGWEHSEDVDSECEDCSCDQELLHLWSILPIPN